MDKNLGKIYKYYDKLRKRKGDMKKKLYKIGGVILNTSKELPGNDLLLSIVHENTVYVMNTNFDCDGPTEVKQDVSATTRKLINICYSVTTVL